MVRSFVALMRTEAGFDPNGVLTFGLSNLRFRSPDEARAVFRQLRDKPISNVRCRTTLESTP